LIDSVQFTSSAQQDIRLAARYYEDQLGGLGLKFAAAVQSQATSALSVPTRFPIIINDIQQCKVKKFPYTIYFRIINNLMVVICVHAVRRDPAELLRLLAKR
jgi:hypothetical protein